MESKLYETIGRKQVRIEDLDAAYDSLLGVLAGVVSGDIAPARVLVNLTERSWTVAEPGQQPAMPATINGLPRCVTAPAQPQMPEDVRRELDAYAEEMRREHLRRQG